LVIRIAGVMVMPAAFIFSVSTSSSSRICWVIQGVCSVIIRFSVAWVAGDNLSNAALLANSTPSK